MKCSQNKNYLAIVLVVIGLLGSASGFAQSGGTVTPLFHPTDSSIQRILALFKNCLLYTSPSPRDRTRSRMPSSA